MGKLHDFLEGVNQPDTPAGEAEPDPKPEPTKDGKDDDRTPEQVRGELLRKMKESEARLDGRLAQISDQLGQITTQSQATNSSTPNNADANDLKTYSVVQLEQLKQTTDWSKVSEADKDAFDSILNKRQIDEAVGSKLAVFTEQTQLDGERKRFGQIAADRFPDITDSTSDFARKVQVQLDKTPDMYIDTNPRIVLDIANDIAISEGIKPQRRRMVSGKPAPTRTTPAGGTESQGRSDEEHEQIASRLSNALPRGKKFDMDRIRKKEKDVSDRMIVIRPKREDDLNE